MFLGRRVLVTLLVKIVTGAYKTFPDGVGVLLLYGTNLAPLFLEFCHLIGRLFPVSAVLERFSLLAQGGLLFKVGGHIGLGLLEELTLAAEEHITGCTETLKYLLVLLGRGKTYVLPFLLQCKHLLGLVIPVLESSQFIILYSFQEFTDDGLLVKILFLLILELLKVLLMTLVDNGRCSLEAVPDLLS